MFYRSVIYAWRYLRANAQLSFLKILGLSLALCASLLLIKYIHWQWNFDRFHHHLEDLVRVETHHQDDPSAEIRHHALTYSGLPVLAKERFPEVLSFARLGKWIANDVMIRREQSLYRGDGLFFTDSSFFELFSFQLIEGDPKLALSDPNSVVLTPSLAKQLFGEVNPIGKEVSFENHRSFLVTGIIEEPPTQSHIQYEMLAPLSTMTSWGLEVYSDDQLDASYVYAYLLLQPGTNLTSLAQRLSNEFAQARDVSGTSPHFTLRPMGKVHLHASLEGDVPGNGAGNSIWILGGIAAFILLLAWINYFNIFNATYLTHTPSLSVRRIVGAGRRHLFIHIVVTAGLGVFISLAIGLGVVLLSQRWILTYFEIPLANVGITDFISSGPSRYLGIFLLLGGVFAVILPAWMLSKVGPDKILQSHTQDLLRPLTHQSLLTTLQFAVVILLLSGTMLIKRQTEFMQSRSLGFSADQIVSIRGPLGMDFELLRSAQPAFFNELNALAGVESTSISHHIPGNELELVTADDKNIDGISFNYYRNYGDRNYFDLYKIKWLALDSVAINTQVNKRFCVLNKMAAELLGFYTPENALGTVINRWNQDLQVVGVTENHHQRSLHQPVTPIIHDFSTDNLMTDGFYSIRHARSDADDLLKEVQALFKKHFPYTVFEPVDVARNYADQYQAENRLYLLNLGFSILGLVIGGLGLLALTIATIGRRMKEISIRRILGANVSDILHLLSRDYMKIIGVALLIASPVSYYLGQQWLANFAFQVSMEWWIFLGSGLAAVALGFLIILQQSWKVTTSNPMDSLRAE